MREGFNHEGFVISANGFVFDLWTTQKMIPYRAEDFRKHWHLDLIGFLSSDEFVDLKSANPHASFFRRKNTQLKKFIFDNADELAKEVTEQP